MQLPEDQQGWIVFIVFCAFALCALVQVWYFAYYFSRVAFRSKKERPASEPPASVLICARNEAANLEKNIPLIMQQDYPDFEVIVINDCSWDDSEMVLKSLGQQYPALRVITIKEDQYFSHGKKVAVMVGIKGAKSEYLLFTDADCRPASNQWIRNMLQSFDQHCDIVLGYGPYERTAGFLNKLIRFDAFTIGLQYLGMASAGVPYMGVGRNLAYKRSLFFKVKGFASHYHIESGDDDLFVNEAATSGNTVAMTTAESMTVSIPESSFRNWLRQKRRHSTTFRHYKAGTRLRLGLFGLSQYLFYLLLLFLLVFQFELIIVLAIFGVHLLLRSVIMFRSMSRLGEKDLFWLYPVYEACLMFLYPVISISNRFRKKNKWRK
ncbi:MAG: glycosyltransferase [Bacteroidia bacterium]|nr:glycosyltransferase [Bacteroidia bacterium]